MERSAWNDLRAPSFSAFIPPPRVRKRQCKRLDFLDRWPTVVVIVVILLLVVNKYILNTSRRALKPSQPRQGKQLGYCAHENERESPTCGRNSEAKARKINEAERFIGLGALPKLPMYKYPILHCAYILAVPLRHPPFLPIRFSYK